MNAGFLVNVQVVRSFSLFIVLGFIVLALYWRKQDGYDVARDTFAFFLFFMLYAASSTLLAGFRLHDTRYFYLLQRLFSLPTLFFLFFSILKYPHTKIPSEYQKEAQIFIAFIGLQILLNAGALLALWVLHVNTLPFWFDLTREILILSVPVWLAFVAHRRSRDFYSQGKFNISTFMRRASAVFLAVAGILAVITTRDLLPFSAKYHGIVGAHGWIILVLIVSFSFFVLQRNQTSFVTRASIIVILLIFLTLDFVAYLLIISLPMTESAQLLLYEEDRILRPVILAQLLLAIALSFLVPRIVRAAFPDNSPSLSPPIPFVEPPALTLRQREVLRLLAMDLTNKGIASHLDITERTVKHHITQLLTKFERSSRYELSELARKLIEQKNL